MPDEPLLTTRSLRANVPSPTVLVTVGIALCAAVLGWLVGPRAADLGDTVTGDVALAAQVRDLGGDPPYTGLAVALVEGDTMRTAGLGTTTAAALTPVDAATPFEVGSISKVVTGMLLADLADAGRLDRDTRLGAIYPDVTFTDPQVAEITLVELSTHLSGLPTTIPGGVGGLLRTYASTWMGTNPFADVQPDDVVTAAATVEAGDRTTPIYPNFGVALLGHALAQHEQTPYPQLVTDRLIGPLELTSTTVQDPDDDPPAGHARPHRSSGAAVEPWVGPGELPAGAGGLWSSVADLARLAVAVRDGTVPGASAAGPIAEHAPDRQVGLGWIISDHDGQQVTWHNGATDGTSSFMGFTDEEAVAVLATGGPVGTRPVDPIALQLLGVDTDPDTGIGVQFSPMLIATVALPATAGLSLLLGALRRGARADKHAIDRLGLASRAVWGMLLLALSWRAGLWDRVPTLVWIASVGMFGGGLAASVMRWPGLPIIAQGRPWQRWAGLGASIAVTIAYGAVLVATLLRLA